MLEEPETKDAVKAAVEEHTRMVIGDQMDRQQKCMRAVQEALKKYGCDLVPRCLLSPGGIEWMVETIAKSKEALEAIELQKEQAKKELAEKIAARGEKHAREAGPVSQKGKGQSGRKKKKG
jgi:hypothetical protein